MADCFQVTLMCGIIGIVAEGLELNPRMLLLEKHTLECLFCQILNPSFAVFTAFGRLPSA